MAVAATRMRAISRTPAMWTVEAIEMRAMLRTQATAMAAALPTPANQMPGRPTLERPTLESRTLVRIRSMASSCSP